MNSSLSVNTTNIQKFIIDLNSKTQHKMTKMHVNAQNVIAEDQARLEEQIMKQIQKSKDSTEEKHREDMRSSAIILAKILRTSIQQPSHRSFTNFTAKY